MEHVLIMPFLGRIFNPLGGGLAGGTGYQFIRAKKVVLVVASDCLMVFLGIELLLWSFNWGMVLAHLIPLQIGVILQSV